MRKLTGLRRTLAGVLAVLTVAGCMPANVGDVLTGGGAIVARAAFTDDTFVRKTNRADVDKDEVGELTTTEAESWAQANLDEITSLTTPFGSIDDSKPDAYQAMLVFKEGDNYRYVLVSNGVDENGVVVEGCKVLGICDLGDDWFDDVKNNDEANWLDQGGVIFFAKLDSSAATDPVGFSASDFNVTVPQNAVYSGRQQSATVEATSETTPSYTVYYYTNESCTEGKTTDAPVNAGTYYIGIEVEGQDGVITNPTWKFTIAQKSIDSKIVIKVGNETVNNITYTGASEYIVSVSENPGNAEVTFTYAKRTGDQSSDDNSLSWNNAKPTAAGSYWVKAQINASANYGAQTVYALLTITKASISVNPLPQLVADLTYQVGEDNNGVEQSLVTAGTVSPVTFNVKYYVNGVNDAAPAADADGWSDSIPKKANAGKYQVWYKVDGNDNYESIAPTSLGVAEIKKAKDTIQTHPKFAGDYEDYKPVTKVYYYNSGNDIAIFTGGIVPNGAHSEIEYAWDNENDWHAGNPTRSAAGTYTLRYRAKGDGVNFDPSDVESVKINVQGFETTPDINKFNSSQIEILRLDSDINGNVGITRNGGIIDLNGHKINGCLVLQNSTAPIIVMNGTVGSGGDGIDDGGGYQPQWKGDVILWNVKVNGNAWGGARTFRTLGTTNISYWRRESGNLITYAGTLINLEDLHIEDDENVKLSNQVRKAIKSIQIGNSNPVNFSGEADPDPVLFYEKGQTVKITSGARLMFNNVKSTEIGITEDKNDSGYVYTLTVPSDNSLSNIVVNRWYEYQIDSQGDDKLVGKDTHVIPEPASDTIASLKAEDHEYLSDFDDSVKMTINESFELKTTSEYQYYALDENGAETQLTKKPSEVGSYRVKAGIFFFSNGQSQEYWMTKDVQIKRRNYTNHSGNNAKPGQDEMKMTVKAGNADTAYAAYNGGEQKPSITIADTNYKGNRTLVRGTDYEVYKLVDGNYVLVETDDVLAETSVGDYTFYVKFLGNYTSDNEYEPVNWRIINANINAEGLAPTANTLTYDTSDQTLVKEGETASQYGTTYYRLAVDGAEWSTKIPTAKNAGAYAVQWYIKAGSNYNDLGSETAPAGTVNVTISPKAVENPRIELTGEAFIYDGTEKTYAAENISVYDGNDLIEPSEYSVAYENNTTAGNEAYIKVRDAAESGNYIITETKKNFIIQKATPTVTIELADSANGITYDGAQVETVHGDAHTDKDFIVKDTNPQADAYNVKFYADNNGTKGALLEEAPKDAGTYWAFVTLAESDNYNAATDEMRFVIKQKNIDGVSIEAGAPTADADAVTPKGKEPTFLIVKDGQGILTEGEDFTAEYNDNIYSTNSAKITLTGKGNYTGTVNGSYSVLTTLDISNVKNLITKIKDGNQTITENFGDTYVTKAGREFTVYSKGKLQFSELGEIAEHVDNNGYFYTFSIPEGVNKCTVTHKYAYRTQQTPATSIDNNGDVVISGYDSNVQSGTNVYLPIVKVHFNNVYYLDNPAEKVTVQSVDNPAPGTSYQEISKKFFDNAGREIDVSKPLNVGTYKVEVKIRVSYGSDHQDVYVKRSFQVLERSSDNVTVKLAEDHFEYDGTEKTAVITVTDSGRPANSPMVRGTDYEFGYYTVDGEERVWHKYTDNSFLTKTEVNTYDVTVKFIGNYTGEKTVKWHITNAKLPEMLIVPDDDLVYNHKTHPVQVKPKNEDDVIPDGSVQIRYGDVEKTLADWDSLKDVAPTDAGKYRAFIKLTNAGSYSFATDQSTWIEFEVQKKDIESEDIKFVYPEFSILEGPKQPVKCEPITATDNSYELVEGVDFTIDTYQTNKPRKDFPVLINGKGNYTGNTYLEWDIIAEADAVKLNITDPAATVNASGNGRVSATFNCEVMENLEIVEKGVLYVKNAKCETPLTLEAVDENGIGKKESKEKSSGSMTLNVLDTGAGAKLRGYVIVKYGDRNKTLYTNEVGGSYLGLEIDKAAEVNMTAPKATVNASGKGRVSATFTFTLKEGYTVSKSGVLYVKNEKCATELTLENVGTANIGNKESATKSDNITLNVTDEGNGAKLRGYVTVTTVDGAEKTFYSEEVSGNYTDLAFDEAVTVNMSAPTATVNASTGAKRVSSTFTFNLKEGYSVVESGILYVKDEACATELTLDTCGTSGIGKMKSSTNSGSMTLNVTDTGKGAKLRGYVQISDGKNTRIIYTDTVSGTYAALSAKQ